MRIAFVLLLIVVFMHSPAFAQKHAHGDAGIQCKSSYKPQGDNVSLYKVDWEAYFATMTSKIKKKWHPPLRFDKKTYKTIVLLKIDKNGNLIDSKLVSYCTCKEKEAKATLKAVNDAAPFEKLPENFSKDTLVVEYEFKSSFYAGDTVNPKVAL